MAITTYKTWIIQQEEFARDDLLWLNRFGIQFVPPNTDTMTFDHGGRLYQYVGAITKNFGAVTTTQKQEDMLFLKYGNCILFSQVMAVDE